LGFYQDIFLPFYTGLPCGDVELPVGVVINAFD
jgi:hypothetical protein